MSINTNTPSVYRALTHAINLYRHTVLSNVPFIAAILILNVLLNYFSLETSFYSPDYNTEYNNSYLDTDETTSQINQESLITTLNFSSPSLWILLIFNTITSLYLLLILFYRLEGVIRNKELSWSDILYHSTYKLPALFAIFFIIMAVILLPLLFVGLIDQSNQSFLSLIFSVITIVVLFYSLINTTRWIMCPFILISQNTNLIETFKLCNNLINRPIIWLKTLNITLISVFSTMIFSVFSALLVQNISQLFGYEFSIEDLNSSLSIGILLAIINAFFYSLTYSIPLCWLHELLSCQNENSDNNDSVDENDNSHKDNSHKDNSHKDSTEI